MGAGVTTARADERAPEQTEREPEPEPVGPQICLSDDIDPEPARPQICLSDIDIEGEVEPRPTRSRPSGQSSSPATGPGAAPQVCLSLMPESANRGYRHDGFYLRASAGGGWLVVGIDDDLSSRTTSGAAASLALDAGITIARGLVVGIGVSALHAPSPSAGISQLDLYRLGPLLDWFPEPTSGFHAGAGPGPMVVRVDGERSDASAVALGGAVWVGYDAWVAEEWSLGSRISGYGAWAGRADDALRSRLSARAIAIELSLVYH